MLLFKKIIDGCAKVTGTAAGKGLARRQVQAATTDTTGLTCFIFRFLRRPPEDRQGRFCGLMHPIPLDSWEKPQACPVWFVFAALVEATSIQKPAKRFPGPAARLLACKAGLLGETLCRGRSPEPTRSAVLVFGVSGFTPWGHLMLLG